MPHEWLRILHVSLVGGAYFLGGFPAAYYWVWWRRGIDIRTAGSGNAGARNAGRLLGPVAFAVVLGLDASKGGLAVVLTQQLTGAQPIPGLALLAATAGHIWPPLLRFRGGKGLATAAGAMLAWDPPLFLLMAASLGLGGVLTRRGIWGLLVSVAAGPVFAAVLERGPWRIATVATLAVLLAFSHRDNIASALRTPRPDSDAETT